MRTTNSAIHHRRGAGGHTITASRPMPGAAGHLPVDTPRAFPSRGGEPVWASARSRALCSARPCRSHDSRRPGLCKRGPGRGERLVQSCVSRAAVQVTIPSTSRRARAEGLLQLRPATFCRMLPRRCFGGYRAWPQMCFGVYCYGKCFF